jgi:cellulose synthase/poly-beta-1,6-N-acetylglucosamine synthase-like glycosyltransferase
MVLLFWLAVAVVAYVYLGYAVVLYCGMRMAESGWLPGWRAEQTATVPRSASRVPRYDGVSIVIAARNEGARLAGRIDNLLRLDFPAGSRQIIVVSDGSTDDTLDVLARYRGVVDAVVVPAGGKALALNAGMARARGDIVVFADARQMFAPDAIAELVAPFADPQVGAVTGELLLDAESPCRRGTADRRAADRRRVARSGARDRRVDDRRRTVRSTIAEGVGLYWRYEKLLRKLESAIDSTLGATGAIYAMRRSLFQPLPADTILDDVLTPMRIVLAGYRVVFNERAKAYDRAAEDADAEARRKIRTLAGNYQILALEPRLLLPWRNRVWLQYVSHKLGRLVVPYAMLAMFAASVALAGAHVFYAVWLAAQVAFFVLAGCGAVIEYRGRIASARAAATAPALRTTTMPTGAA